MLMSCMKKWKNQIGIATQEADLEEMTKDMHDAGLTLNHGDAVYEEEKSRLEKETAEAQKIHAHVEAKHTNFMAHIAF